jgi:hypothetical protein
MIPVGVIEGLNFRLLSDQASAALLAAAEAAAAAAIAAKNAAEAAAADVQRSTFATVALAEASAPDAIPAFIQTIGLSEASDGGGGIYGNPTEAEPTIGPKLFNAHVNRWFTGTETVMDIMRFGARRLGSGTSGVIASNDVAFFDAKEWLHGRLIGGAVPELQFGPGRYDYSEFPNFAKNRAVIRGLGDVFLRFHGSGVAVTLDGLAQSTTPPFTDGAWEMKFLGFKVESPASAAGDGILIRAVHESDFDIETRGCSGTEGEYEGAGLRLQWLVSSRIRYRCAVNGFGWYDNAVPKFALLVDDHDPSLDFDADAVADYTATSFCHIHADTTSAQYGVLLREANGIMLRGTFQSHPITGVTFEENAQDCTLFNSDMEANPLFDFFMAGKKNSIRDCVTLGASAFDGDAFNNTVSGGNHGAITLGASTRANRISAAVTSITDNGIGNITAGSTLKATQNPFKRAKQVLSVEPVGTLRTWTNPYGDPVVLQIVGGTVEGMSVNGEPVEGAAIRVQQLVPPGAVVEWDASVPPATVKIWGL